MDEFMNVAKDNYNQPHATLLSFCSMFLTQYFIDSQSTKAEVIFSGDLIFFLNALKL